jgi:hypothetical protein
LAELVFLAELLFVMKAFFEESLSDLNISEHILYPLTGSPITIAIIWIEHPMQAGSKPLGKGFLDSLLNGSLCAADINYIRRSHSSLLPIAYIYHGQLERRSFR